jgi:uncharacterized protein (DUF58 family)
MLIIALVLAVIGLAALVFAVVTSNELVAWVCIAASVLGVVLLIVDALQERQRRATGARADGSAEAGSQGGEGAAGRTATASADSDAGETQYEDYPEDTAEHVGGEEVSAHRRQSGAGASEEPGGSDEYDHGNDLGDDNAH